MTAGYPSIRWKLLEAHIYTIHPATRIDVRGVGDPAFADRNEGVTSRKGAQKQKMLFFNDVAPEHGSGFFHQKMGPEFFTRKRAGFHPKHRMSFFILFTGTGPRDHHHWNRLVLEMGFLGLSSRFGDSKVKKCHFKILNPFPPV